MKMFLMRVASCLVLLCCLGLLQVVLAAPLVHADGGAPNLAYVSGTTATAPQNTARSIIIDVIIGTIAVSLSVLVVSLGMQFRLARQRRK